MQTQPRRQSRRTRFTLIEMMVVLAIIAGLAALVGPAIFKQLKKADATTAKTQIVQLGNAVKDYYIDTREYPKKIEDLVQNPGSDKWNGPYLEGGALPKDPWGESYHYDCPGIHNPKDVDIYTYGADKAPGGENENADTGNWSADKP